MVLKFFTNPFLALTYNNKLLTDGLGSQLHRILGIYWITKHFKIKYIHNGIHDFLWHPLDHWTTEVEKQLFIKEVNNKFYLPSDSFEVTKVVFCEYLTMQLFLWYYLKSFCIRQNILIEVLHGFQSPREPLPFSLNFTRSQFVGEKLVVVHIRKSLPLNGVIQWRDLDLEYFHKILEAVIRQINEDSHAYKIVVLTDRSQESVQLSISSIDTAHLSLYALSPAQVLRGSIQIEGLNLEKEFSSIESKVDIVYGGNPLIALEIMAVADYLIMSRSSLSAVGALLNRDGIVVQPPDWHYFSSKSWLPSASLIKLESKWRDPGLSKFHLLIRATRRSANLLFRRVL